MRHLAVIELAAAPERTGRVRKSPFRTRGGIKIIRRVCRARAKSTSTRRRRRHQPPPRQQLTKREAVTDQGRCPPTPWGPQGAPELKHRHRTAPNTGAERQQSSSPPPSQLISPAPTTTNPLRTRAEHAMCLLDNSSPSQRAHKHIITAQLEQSGKKKMHPGEPTHISMGNHPHSGNAEAGADATLSPRQE
jgi:hypothetical protein